MLGPELAMLTMPRALCRNAARISSENLPPHMDSPPFPLPTAEDFVRRERMVPVGGEGAADGGEGPSYLWGRLFAP